MCLPSARDRGRGQPWWWPSAWWELWLPAAHRGASCGCRACASCGGACCRGVRAPSPPPPSWRRRRRARPTLAPAPFRRRNLRDAARSQAATFAIATFSPCRDTLGRQCHFAAAAAFAADSRSAAPAAFSAAHPRRRNLLRRRPHLFGDRWPGGTTMSSSRSPSPSSPNAACPRRSAPLRRCSCGARGTFGRSHGIVLWRRNALPNSTEDGPGADELLEGFRPSARAPRQVSGSSSRSSGASSSSHRAQKLPRPWPSHGAALSCCYHFSSSSTRAFCPALDERCCLAHQRRPPPLLPEEGRSPAAGSRRGAAGREKMMLIRGWPARRRRRQRRASLQFRKRAVQLQSRREWRRRRRARLRWRPRRRVRLEPWRTSRSVL